MASRVDGLGSELYLSWMLYATSERMAAFTLVFGRVVAVGSAEKSVSGSGRAHPGVAWQSGEVAAGCG